MILGEFYANGIKASVLFDSGATGSFISSKFVEKAKIPSENRTHPIVVTSPLGENKCDLICKGVILTIKGRQFTVNPTILPSKGVDIILGMDWLAKYNGVISCATRSVQLTHPIRQIIRIKALPSQKVCKMYHLEQKTIEVVPVVCEFMDVFPEDLPGLPPDRDIEFVIELLPGTAPIAQRPYRMSAVELDELKKQLEELE